MNHQRLKCYLLLLDIAKRSPSLLARIPRGHNYIVDQFKRALSSAILNLSEGNGRISTKEKRRFFDISLASISECSSAIDIMLAYCLISTNAGHEFRSAFGQAYAMIVGLKRSTI